MSALEEFRSELGATSQEMIRIGDEKLAFIDQAITPLRERIQMATGLAKHLGALIEGILEDTTAHYRASSDFYDRSKGILEHAKSMLNNGDEERAKPLLNALFTMHWVEVKPVDSDVEPLVSYVDRIEVLARGLERAGHRFQEVNDRRAETIRHNQENISQSLQAYIADL